MRTHRALLFLIGIIALGAVLRIYHMRTLATFRGDQAIELTGSAQILKGRLMLTGIKTSNSEMRNGALMYYIVAPFLFLFRYDPIAGGVAQTLLSLLTIPIVYGVGKRFRNERVGMTAAFLIAASALLVRFSRQNMLAFSPLFFAAVALFLMVSLATHFRKRLSLILGIVLGGMLQIHYSSLAVGFAAVILPWLFLHKSKIKDYFLFLIAGFLIGFLPMLLYEVRHDFFNSRMFLELISHGVEGDVQRGFSQITFWRDIISLTVSGGNAKVAGICMAAVVAAGILYRKKLSLVEKLCVMQIISTALFSLLFVRSSTAHYAVSAMPALFVLLSSFLDRTLQAIWAKKRYLPYAAVMAGFFFLNFPSYGFPENHGWTMEDGWNLDGVKKAATIINEDVKNATWKQNYNIVMIVDGETKGFPLRYFLDLWGVPPLVPEVYATADALYVVNTPIRNAENTKVKELELFGTYAKRQQWDIQNRYQLHRLERIPSP